MRSICRRSSEAKHESCSHRRRRGGTACGDQGGGERASGDDLRTERKARQEAVHHRQRPLQCDERCRPGGLLPACGKKPAIPVQRLRAFRQRGDHAAHRGGGRAAEDRTRTARVSGLRPFERHPEGAREDGPFQRGRRAAQHARVGDPDERRSGVGRARRTDGRAVRRGDPCNRRAFLPVHRQHGRRLSVCAGARAHGRSAGGLARSV